MSGSVSRPLLIGSMREASLHWYTAMNRVIFASTGSSYTMSAHDSPVWGRALGRFSTLTARAGRFGTDEATRTPVSGQMGGGGGRVGLPEGPPPGVPLAEGVFFVEPNATSPTTAPMMTTATMSTVRIWPRLVKAMR